MFYILLIGMGIHTNIKAQMVVAKGVSYKSKKIKKGDAKEAGYNIGELTGKWQEMKRKDIAMKSKVSFTDSLQLDFNKRDSVIIRDGISISQRGFASIEDKNNLQVAGDTYTIISLSKSVLVLNDGEYIRELHKKKIFYQETLGKVLVPKDNLSEPVSIDLKAIMGKWVVYRTQAFPGAADDSSIIKHLNFTTLNDDNTVSGVITFTKANNTESHPFKATLEKGTILINTQSHFWNMYTYKLNSKEFVFGKHGGLVYFSKQF